MPVNMKIFRDWLDWSERTEREISNIARQTKQQADIYVIKPVQYAIEDVSKLPETIPKKINRSFDKILSYGILAGVLWLLWKTSKK